MNLTLLKEELANDPLTIGYAGMDDVAVASSLNDVTMGRTKQVETLNATDLYEAIDTAEFNALTGSEKSAVDRILGLGDGIVVVSGSKARSVLLAAFGAGSVTRAAIIAIAVLPVSRAEELGLPRIKVGNVQEARL